MDGFHRRVRRTEDMPTARNLERNYEVHRVETYNLDGTLRSVTGEKLRWHAISTTPLMRRAA